MIFASLNLEIFFNDIPPTADTAKVSAEREIARINNSMYVISNVIFF
jgi:hypothetical protein